MVEIAKGNWLFLRWFNFTKVVITLVVSLYFYFFIHHAVLLREKKWKSSSLYKHQIYTLFIILQRKELTGLKNIKSLTVKFSQYCKCSLPCWVSRPLLFLSLCLYFDLSRLPPSFLLFISFLCPMSLFFAHSPLFSDVQYHINEMSRIEGDSKS